MSSLHQDRLLVEGSGPVIGTASTLPSARGTRRRAVGTIAKQATGKVPTQRLGTAQQSATTKTNTTAAATTAEPSAPRARHAAGTEAAAATGSLAARAKAVTVKAASAKAATAKAATVKAASAKAATAKAATAARAAAVRAVTNRTASVPVARATRAVAPAAKPDVTRAAQPVATKAAGTMATKAAATTPTTAKAATTTKPAAAKAAPAKAATAKPAPARATSPKAVTLKAATARPAPAKAATAKAAVGKAPRPTPYKRTPLASGPLAPEVLAPVVDAADVLSLETPEVVRADASLESMATDAATDVRLPQLLRRRPPSVRRRAALYLAAALVGALGVTSITTDDPEAQAAATVSQSVSVAEQLGIEASNPTQGLAGKAATDRLGELAVSRNARNARDAEQAAAAQAQAQADRLAAEAAAEAARPKAVFPIEGARLTSKFGPRWGSMHNGLDLAAPMMTPEYAAADGVVLEAGPASGFGLAVYIQHENGDVTVYGHMEEILVQAGQVVKAGESIALVGNRGQSTGPHLHFEVRSGGPTGTPIDPLVWLRERGVST